MGGLSRFSHLPPTLDALISWKVSVSSFILILHSSIGTSLPGTENSNRVETCLSQYESHCCPEECGSGHKAKLERKKSGNIRCLRSGSEQL